MQKPALDELLPLVRCAEVLAQKYDVVVTNPPYMGASGMNARLSQYVKDHFPDTKADLFSCFIERGFQLANVQGFVSMITMESWMFLSSFEKMRQNIVNTHTIVNMVHMPYLGKGGTSLGINFGTAAVIFNKRYCRDYNSQFDYICYYETDENGVPFAFPTVNERYRASKATNFSKIPGAPVAYWVSENFCMTFQRFPLMKNIGKPVEGIKTGDNDTFLRLWHETNRNDEHLQRGDPQNLQWHKMAKGGSYRKWYGNLEYVCKWGKDGKLLKQAKGATISNTELFFSPAITWTYLTSGQFSMRDIGSDVLYNNKGPACYIDGKIEFYCLGLMNSKVVQEILAVLAPTIDCKPGNIANVPVALNENEKVSDIVEQNIIISKADWDSDESSWDFKRNPLV